MVNTQKLAFYSKVSLFPLNHVTVIIILHPIFDRKTSCWHRCEKKSSSKTHLIITLYNVCSTVGVISTVRGVQYHGGSHDYRGGYLAYCGVFSTVEGNHEYCGGYLECPGGVQYHGGYHDACGDIMSTVEGVQYHVGKNLLLFKYPTVLKLQRMVSPHSTEHPP